MKTTRQPNPGSKAAIALGCSCPVLDNNHGFGCGWGKGVFWRTEDCPLHGRRVKKTRKKLLQN